MGKALATRKGFMVRLTEEDVELAEWLGQFAHSQTMTKVVKLACYMLSGIQPEAGLLAMLPEIRDQQVEPHPAYSEPVPTELPSEDTGDALAAVMQELSALREELRDQQAYSASEAPAMSDRRRRHYEKHGPPDGDSDAWSRRDIFDPSPWASQEEETTRSSGLDMSPRRRPPGPPKITQPATPVENPVMDAEEARRRLVASIHAYGKEFKRGH